MSRPTLEKFAKGARHELRIALESQLHTYRLPKGEADPKWDQKLIEQHAKLKERLAKKGRDKVLEEASFTWFNRLSALRFMELRGYIPRSLSTTVAGRVDPDLLHDRDQRAGELGFESVPTGTDEEIYRELLLAQCNQLHDNLPFLFEKLGAEDEMLLPANLLSPHSIRGHLLAVEEQEWQEIEVIGWLYQYYISERKDQVIGKEVKTKDIPAATQLFTPNWIVKYMVQNALGAQWLATYPESPLKGEMEYYIEPAEQSEQVKAQLAANTPSQLEPEELTLIDPACGSGHILVEAYELFKTLYLERGYRQRDVPQLILEKNLFGLDIDERAAQLTGFALMMKGRADDRQLFERGVKLNVMALEDSEFDAERLAKEVQLSDYGLKLGDLTELKRLFEHATTFGSLNQVPEGLAEKLPALKQLSETTSSKVFVSDALKGLGPLVQQAELLAAQYDAVVANPPYMGNKGMNAHVKKFAKSHFPAAKSDLFACFIERGYTLAKNEGHNAMVTMQSWMFLSSYEKMRLRMLSEKTIETMAHLGARAFGSISGEVVQTTVFTLSNRPPQGFKPVFFRLVDGTEELKRSALVTGKHRYDTVAQDDFNKISGSPVAYWASKRTREIFSEGEPLESISSIGKGLDTGDNSRFLRRWYENPRGSDWIPCLKGGPFRKWYGNQEYAIYWKDDGAELRAFDGSNLRNAHNYFKPGITWTRVSSSSAAFRVFDEGFIFESTGPCIFSDSIDRRVLTAYLNSKLTGTYLACIAPTLDFQSGHISVIPILKRTLEERDIQDNTNLCIANSKNDWNAYERSWDFQSLPLLTAATATLETSYRAWIAQNRATIAEMKRLEEENNRLFIDAHGLADEISANVPIEQITLTVNPAYRYGGKLSEEEQWTRFRKDTMEELISYAIGCMMGRYSLDTPGLIYAHSGNKGFDPNKYTSFPADDDAIIPILEEDWFEDDVVRRFVAFVERIYGKEGLEASLQFVAKGLGVKQAGTPEETIRRYIIKNFIKTHVKTYKKRPIYWLFTSHPSGRSGGAFQALVYLHRYQLNTMARLRTKYLRRYQETVNHEVEHLEKPVESETPKNRMRREKKLKAYRSKLKEVRAYDEKLKHYADKRQVLDLDDGVAYNYTRFSEVIYWDTGFKEENLKQAAQWKGA